MVLPDWTAKPLRIQRRSGRAACEEVHVISTNWRGEPLRDYETIVRLIARTTTAKGLKVTCRLDRRRYPVGRKVTDA